MEISKETKYLFLRYYLGVIEQHELIRICDETIKQNFNYDDILLELCSINSKSTYEKDLLNITILQFESQNEWSFYELKILNELKYLLESNEILWEKGETILFNLIKFKINKFNLSSNDIDEFTSDILTDFEERRDNLYFVLNMPGDLYKYIYQQIIKLSKNREEC